MDCVKKIHESERYRRTEEKLESTESERAKEGINDVTKSKAGATQVWKADKRTLPRQTIRASTSAVMEGDEVNPLALMGLVKERIKRVLRARWRHPGLVPAVGNLGPVPA